MWISINDRKPEQGELVLMAIYGSDIIVPEEGETVTDAIKRMSRHGRVSVGFIDEDGYWCGADGWPEVIQPKYWMPLPEPPKEG